MVTLFRSLHGQVASRLPDGPLSNQFWLAMSEREELLELLRQRRREEAQRLVLEELENFLQDKAATGAGE